MRLNHRILASAALTFALAAPALAADVVFEEPAAPVAAIAPIAHDWTGFSVGVFGGGATGDAELTDSAALAGEKNDFDGLLGGVQVGYDQQFGSVVVGARASVAATNIDNGDAVLSSKLKYLGTAGVRAGVAVNKLLPYAHAGVAFGQTEQKTSSAAFDSTKLDKADHTGWTAGAGAEYSLTQNISVGAEYGYVDLGKEEVYSGNYSPAGRATATVANEDLTFHTFKAGVNFRF
ncbi:porin family protein [Aureimonas altamirensis]|uniref:outer membrane protein n=1 Tax=Aureimonas altamirensis TaxID=370622 RepID=UPI002036BAAE|nr:outer membrane protein [Aureimonas altamirensis]MCM2503223.1 porin family protein [Aureimonas altamirensis]